ncbi:sensor histidine kinase [Runella sp.]|uniref:sensor histidine kinase n=1 Tax=Runella sp. TaxID=1960881 RepID=UPI003D0A6354
MPRLLFSTLLLGLLSLLNFCASAQPVIDLTEKSIELDLWGKNSIEYLEDLGRKVTIDTLLGDSSLAFKSTQHHLPDFGFTDAHYWIRFRIRKQTNQSINWVLQNDNPMINHLNLFLINEKSGSIFKKTVKEAIPGYQRELNVHQCAIPIDIIPYETYTVYVQIKATDAKEIQLKLSETHHFYNTYFDELWFWTAHIGFVLCMIVVQLVFLLVTKERNFLFYILFLLGYLCIAIIGGYGIIDAIAWPENEWLKMHGIVLAVVLSDVLGALFYIHALRLKQTAPVLYWLLLTDGALPILLSFWIFIFPDSISANVYASTLMFVFFCLVSISCIVSYRRGNVSAIYYLFGTIAYFVGIFIQLLWTLSYVYPNLFVINSMHIGSMLEMIFFTWALAHDYRRTREEREGTQRKLINALQSQNKEISEALVRGQTLERKRVAADLHDSLGGTLSAMRWTLTSLNTGGLTEQEKQVYDSLVEMTNDAHQRVRFLSHNLLPEDLEQEGLQVSIEKLIEKLNRSNKTKFELNLNLAERPNKKIEFELYNIFLELISNVLKHANASEVYISLESLNGFVHLEVFDDGKGINGESRRGKGLYNIQDRIASLGGTWQIESTTKGTSVLAHVPLT